MLVVVVVGIVVVVVGIVVVGIVVVSGIVVVVMSNAAIIVTVSGRLSLAPSLTIRVAVYTPGMSGVNQGLLLVLLSSVAPLPNGGLRFQL